MDKGEMPKAYEPGVYEDAIYAAWEESGLFDPGHLSGDPYTIMMPPPNVTGILHLGHAFENALMDTMARFQRLRGKRVLLLPGTDHAAVATQARVEDELKAGGMENPRQALGREGLLEKIRAYAEASKTTILSQIRKMGTSADWSRLAYTFDDERSRVVNAVFKKMYDDGLIYRGYRVVNWSVVGQSTASDDELEYTERQTVLYSFRYSKDFPIPIATTLPETKLGDTAVAVHPGDDRYKAYIGQVFEPKFAGKRLKIHVIADEHVDPAFGTGALGVTPAHATPDFEMYEKQPEIGLVQVVGLDGTMTQEAGADYAGLPYKEARAKLVEWLRAEGLLEGEEEITHNVALSDRFKDEIWPMPMDQWFVDVRREIPGRGKSLKDLMREAVTTGLHGDASKKVVIAPGRFQKVYLHWIENLHDWCISRQIWWGHRIPIWTKGREVFSGETAPEGDGWEQDPDTLDTWFSSGMWPFSTLGWPAGEDFKTFFPTSWMQMGYEILFLWMARMVLFSAYLHDTVPFRDVYIHGMVRDKDGRKFSKSLNNGIDPLDVIARYGTDALRVSLLSGVSPGNDTRFYEEKVESAQHLVNKLWNISRYIFGQVGRVVRVHKVEPKTLADEWILSKLDGLTAQVTKKLESFDFSSAAEELRDFTGNDFADWYLEIAKIEREKDDILLYVLERLLVLWHPFIPFVTEEIWKRFNIGEFLMVHEWPQKQGGYARGELGKEMKHLQNVIVAIRNLRSENNVEAGKKVTVTLVSAEAAQMLDEQKDLIHGLARVESLTILSEPMKLEEVASTVVGTTEVYLLLEGLMDKEAERGRLAKELEEARKFEANTKAKLENNQFTSKAPAKVVEGIKETYVQTKERIQKLEEQVKRLEG